VICKCAGQTFLNEDCSEVFICHNTHNGSKCTCPQGQMMQVDPFVSSYLDDINIKCVTRYEDHHCQSGLIFNCTEKCQCEGQVLIEENCHYKLTCGFDFVVAEHCQSNNATVMEGMFIDIRQPVDTLEKTCVFDQPYCPGNIALTTCGVRIWTSY